jgi:hypothetical protein
MTSNWISVQVLREDYSRAEARCVSQRQQPPEKSILRAEGAMTGRHSSQKMGLGAGSGENPPKRPGDSRCAF